MSRQASLPPLPPPPPAASSSLNNVNSTAEAADLDDLFDLSQLAGLSTIVYRKGTLECDEMVGLLNAAKIGCRELRRTQLWNNFFAYMSCLIGATIVTRGTVMNQNDIHLNAYT